VSITRRVFLRNGALAVAGTAALPSLLTRAAFGPADPGTRAKRLVVIFQRGAADGLNIVVPHGEPSYYAMRPTINIPKKSVLDLDGFFGLHPSMSAFQPLWKEKHLAIVHAVGSPDPTRAHFEAQDSMESGTPGVRGTDDGWLNRALHGCPADKFLGEKSTCCAISLAHSLPRILSGQAPAVAVVDPNAFSVGGRNPRAATAARANYRRGRFGDSLKQLAQLIKANLGVQVAFADIGGWDHHVNEGSTQGQIANILGDFSRSIAAFWADLGELGEDTVVVTMSEFGRSARENGNCGTDHGHANVMFVLGGPVKGGKVYGRWPGLDQSQLYEGRDLAVTTDFRFVLSEVVSRHLGNKDLNTIFPGFEGQPGQFLRLLG
jgi:uncharacterized protein (DUF1501 family)